MDTVCTPAHRPHCLPHGAWMSPGRLFRGLKPHSPACSPGGPETCTQPHRPPPVFSPADSGFHRVEREARDPAGRHGEFLPGETPLPPLFSRQEDGRRTVRPRHSGARFPRLGGAGVALLGTGLALCSLGCS